MGRTRLLWDEFLLLRGALDWQNGLLRYHGPEKFYLSAGFLTCRLYAAVSEFIGVKIDATSIPSYGSVHRVMGLVTQLTLRR